MTSGRLLLAMLALAPLSAVSCDTHAVGADACRSIEEARCTAARNCDLGIDNDAEEATCKRFADDNCQHGLPTKEPPKSSELSRCLALVRAAGKCAHEQGGETPASECLRGTTVPADATVCEVIQDPDESSECAFLTEKDFPDAATTPDSGGATDAATD